MAGLEMTGRVVDKSKVPVFATPHGTVWPLVGPEPRSQLTLSTVELGPGVTRQLGGSTVDTLFYVVSGSGTVERDGETFPISQGSAALIPALSPAEVVGGPKGLQSVEGMAGYACDLHAPMGATETVTHLDEIRPGAATGARSFQVLFDASNGSTRSTLFIGYIPPGKAPWHFHLYDEIVWVAEGEGRLHIGKTVETLEPGCAFRLYPREVHIVENTSPDQDMTVIGFFTPAGSPSAAYLEPETFATYRGMLNY